MREQKTRKGAWFTWCALWLVCVVGLVSCNVLSVQAETTTDGYEYTVLEDGTVEITGYTGEATELDIPSTIDGKNVTSIRAYAFKHNVKLESVIIPESITTIGDYAFAECAKLNNIVFPDGLTSIGNHAFKRCSYITNIVIPSSVSNIGSGAFYACSRLKKVVISEGVESISDCAFGFCRGLVSVTLPSSLTSIGIDVFEEVSEDCMFLAESDSYAYSALKDAGYVVGVPVTTEDGLQYVEMEDGTLCIISYEGTEETITIPSTINGKNVTSIGDYAFDNCVNLEAVVIPDGVTSIGANAFNDCSSLKSVTVPNSVTSIGDNAFLGCSGDIVLYVSSDSYGYQWAEEENYTAKTPKGKGEYLDNDQYKYIITSDDIDNLTVTFEGILDSDAEEREIIIPSQVTEDGFTYEVTSIGASAFSGNKKLESVSIPITVTAIGVSAFEVVLEYK